MGEDHLAYAGMDDAGEMSAWYVFNAIGLYTYSPADPQYIVTVPLFPTIEMDIHGTPVRIERHGQGETITGITSGGKKQKGWFVSHDDLLKGGLTIEVE
jgi:putative alpha-1,2-mannosidase